MSTVKIGAEKLTLSIYKQILIDNQPIEINDAAIKKVYESHYFLKEFIKDKLIYGVNTGFGPMAQYKISHNDQIQLQYNLIRSHCSGSGNPIAEINVRATMLARLNMLLLGYSGIHPEAITLLKEMINRHITPILFEHGGLGASGDLVQLAHLALAMIGEGDVHYKGEITTAEKAFQAESLTPLNIHIREGLALMNGTSAMCGIGIINLLHAKNILDKATQASSMIIEMVESYDDHYSDELNSVKLHRGQNLIAQNIRTHLIDSKLVKKRGKHLYDQPTTETIVKEKVQEYYSIRCVPQILGPIYDTIAFAEEIIIDEINSANDNPIVDYKNKNVFHGGNFHGDYPAIEMDKLKIAITKLSMLSERQLNFLMNDKLNNKLPSFVNLGILGLNLGMQGTQFTATSTVAENQTLSNPMYIHSIPSNNDNQDIVSMGSNAALMAQKVINNTYEVLAIEFMSIIQAIDYLKCEGKLSSISKKLYSDLRALVPVFDKDTVQYIRQQKIIAYLKQI
ncbi:MAG TPA: aromatic amino acid ammonia-lyase [Bacteroidia bacterium]|jgi:histidine ammonia-lyase|nr:aromatic amino acid ammonia-lyase [Bacteroidia bacterium]